jgi:hypothetical protein
MVQYSNTIRVIITHDLLFGTHPRNNYCNLDSLVLHSLCTRSPDHTERAWEITMSIFLDLIDRLYDWVYAFEPRNHEIRKRMRALRRITQ